MTVGVMRGVSHSTIRHGEQREAIQTCPGGVFRGWWPVVVWWPVLDGHAG